MNRKSTLAYGTRRSRMTESDRPARNAPSSSPPSGLRLVQPTAVPRPVGGSTPPPPASMRAPSLPSLPPPVSVRAPSLRPPPPARPTMQSFAALTAIPPPPASGPRTSPPPRPSPAMRLEELRDEILEDEPEVLGDEDVTVVDSPLVDPAGASSASPLPPVPWTAESTQVPANTATLESFAPPLPATIAAWPAQGLSRAPAPDAEPFAMTVPAPMSAGYDDDVLPPMSPAAVLWTRLLTAWGAATPRVRTAITFGAGFLAGAVTIAAA